MGYALIQGMIGKHTLAALTAGMILAATASAATPIDTGIEQFRKGYHDWSQSGFWKACRTFQQAIAEDPKSPTAHYWLGVAHFHRMLALRGTPGPRTQRIADHEMQCAIDALDATTDLDPDLAEAHAILATLHGMRIDDRLLNKLRHGPLVYQHQKQALKHGARNPRVQYLLGASLLYTAKDDHGRHEAIKALSLADALYQEELKQRRPTNQPRWGHDACLTFLGDAFATLHQPSKAKPYYQKALLLRPGNRAAKAGLDTLTAP